jgi:hypothetical protein
MLPRLLLLLISIGFVASTLEVALRTMYPRYEFAAESDYVRDAQRIYVRQPWSAEIREHVDSGEPYPLLRNNLGMHQHRSIPIEKVKGEVRVGFFGDSFTENVRLYAPHSFTEVLDHLLQRHSGVHTVLNFGVDGYGTDQSYLAFRDAPAAQDLDHIYYVFCANDIRNLYETQIFRLSDEGELIQRPAPMSSWWRSLISKLHVTYFFLDFKNRISVRFGGEAQSVADHVYRFRRAVASGQRLEQSERSHDAEADGIEDDLLSAVASDRSQHYIKLMQRLLGRWRAEATARGASFHVVLLPSEQESTQAKLFEGYSLINLSREFQRYSIAERDWTFENDGHWNEFGNQLAARALYLHLASALGLEPYPPLEIDHAINDYYSAWPLRWQTPKANSPGKQSPERNLAAVRRRYSELEQPPPGPDSRE